MKISFKKAKGSITILLTLIMLPMMTSAGLIVDGSRISTAKNAVSGAGDLALNAALSDYNFNLEDIYGLFANSEDMDELSKNVSRYFNNTIEGTNILADDDSYTRGFLNSVLSNFSDGKFNLDTEDSNHNIVDMKVDSDQPFKLSGVEDSSIANPQVMKRQIVDYMKYRAPINLGKGLLTKLKCLGETSKQTKAVEAKVTFDQKLGDLQSCCKTAFDDINTYLYLYDTTKYKTMKDTSDIDADINNVEEDIKKYTKYIVAYKSSGLDYHDITTDGKLYTDLAAFNLELEKSYNDQVDKNNEKDDKDKESLNKNKYALDMLEDKLNDKVKLTYDTVKKEYTVETTDFTKLINNVTPSGSNDFDKQVNDITNLSKLEDERKTYLYLQQYDNFYNLLKKDKVFYDTLSEDDQKKYSDKEDIYSGYMRAIENCYAKVSEIKKSWRSSASQTIKNDLYTNWYKDLQSMIDYLNNSLTALNAVKKTVGEVKTTKDEWHSKIDNLAESEQKSTMNADYKVSTKDINLNDVDTLISLLTNTRDYFSSIKSKLEGNKFYDDILCENQDGENYFDIFESSIGDKKVKTLSEINSASDKIISDNYKKVSVSDVSGKAEKVTTDKFYKYLKKVCKVTNTATDEEKQKAKNGRTELVKQSNKKTEEIPTSASSVDVSSKTLSGAVGADNQKLIDDFYKNQKIQIDEKNTEQYKKEQYCSNTNQDNSSEMANSQKQNLSAAAGLFDSISGILDMARDKFLYEEYMTEMFSCMTDTIEKKDDKGNKIIAKSINNKEMSDNALYGSEIEYLLYGQDSAETNINLSKASIFALRFALNSIFAFTNAEKRGETLTAATAVAGWTGFGIPIVQTVITLAWAMAESFADMDDLCSGKPVAVYKTAQTWHLSIQGAIEKGKDDATKMIDDVYEKVSTIADDKIDDLGETINDYSENTLKGLSENLTNSITAPLTDLFNDIVVDGVDLTKEDISKEYDEYVEGLSEGEDDGSATSEAKKVAITYLKGEGKDFIVVELDRVKQVAVDTPNLVNGEITEFIKNIKDKLSDSITGIISKYSNKLKDEVKGVLNNSSDKVKEKINDSIDEFADKIGGTVSKGAGKVGKGGKPSAGAGFAMTYKEYLKVFTMIAVMADEDGMIKKTALLIQTNIGKKDSGFNITKSYTMLRADATVDVKTTFFNMFSSVKNSNGSSSTAVNYSDMGTKYSPVKYTGILGY